MSLPADKPETKSISVQTLLTVLPVLSGGLYAIGMTYQEGYFAGFGVESSSFSLPPDRILFLGLTSLISFGIGPLAYSVLVLLALVSAVLIAAVLSSLPAVKQRQARSAEWLASKRSTSKPAPSMIALIDKGEVSTAMSSGYWLSPLRSFWQRSSHGRRARSMPRSTSRNGRTGGRGFRLLWLMANSHCHRSKLHVARSIALSGQAVKRGWYDTSRSSN